MEFDLVQAVFDTFGDFDLTLSGQQLDRAHLTHVHADRVGGPAELGIDARKRGFGFLGGIVVVVGDRGLGQEQGLGIRRLLVHGDTHVVDHVNDIFDLFGIDDVVRQMIIHFRIRQEALLLATGNQLFQLLGLLAAANHSAFVAQDEPPSK